MERPDICPPHPTQRDRPATIGKYRIDRELGRGAMGIVYQAFDLVVERHVALKTIRFDTPGHLEFLDLLRREARSVGQFEHPNIITLYDAGEFNGAFYMVMQLVQGDTLRQRMNAQRWYKLPQVIDIFRQILSGLGYAHERGVVHRDIKPSNIMINSEGVVKVADFGIAKVISSEASLPGLVLGTPSYMSPEQVLSRPVDARSDLFSVGCTLYEVLTGEKAFPGDTATVVMYNIVHTAPIRPAALRPGLDPRMEEIVLRALANDPSDRFQSCSEMMSALEECLAPRTGRVVTTPPREKELHTLKPVRASSVPLKDRVSAALPRRLLLRLIVIVLTAILIGVMIAERKPAPVSIAVSPPAAPVVVQPKPSTMTDPEPVVPSAESTPEEQAIRPPEVIVVRAPNPPVNVRAPAAVISPHPSPIPQSPVVAALAEDLQSLLLRGDIAFQKNAYDRALADYLKAHQLKPDNPAVRRKLRTVLMLLGRAQEAQKYR